MRICVTTLRARYRAKTAARLPYHAGSMWRGVLGRALWETGCPRSGGCEGSCARKPDCRYGNLFEPLVPSPSPHRLLTAGSAAAPRLIPVLPPPGQIDLAPGDPVSLDLRVLGRISEADLAGLFAALKRISNRELGGHDGAQLEPLGAEVLGLRNGELVIERSDGSQRRATVEFTTPLHLRHRGRDLVAPSFLDILLNLNRHLTRVAALYGDVLPDDELAFEELRALAADVRTAAIDVNSLAWKRKALDGPEHPMRGILGRIRFEGPLGPFVSRLRAAEVVHFGKSTAFGLGRPHVHFE